MPEVYSLLSALSSTAAINCSRHFGLSSVAVPRLGAGTRKSVSVAHTKHPSPTTPVDHDAVPSVRHRPDSDGLRHGDENCSRPATFTSCLPCLTKERVCTHQLGRLLQADVRANSQTLLEVAANPKRLGAEIGFFSILRNLGFEPPASSPYPLCRYRPWIICGPSTQDTHVSSSVSAAGSIPAPTLPCFRTVRMRTQR